MMKMLKRLSVGFSALALMFVVGVANTYAAAIDYASSTQAVDDATSGLGAALNSGALKVVGIALGVWIIFWVVGKLRKHTK